MDKFNDRISPVNLNKLKEWKNFYSFDHNVTAVLHGFESADDYYNQSSSKQFLKHIKIPTLILHSRDDPFMTEKAIPSETELSSSITLELTENGGHVGFLNGKTPFNVKYWPEERLSHFFNLIFYPNLGNA